MNTDLLWWLFVAFLGWLLGWAVLRSPRCALLPALLSVLLFVTGQTFNISLPWLKGYDVWPAIAVSLILGIILLGVQRLPQFNNRVLATSLLVPVEVWHVLWLGGTAFFSVLKIP